MNLFELFVKIDADTSQAEKGMKNTQETSETLTNKIKVMSAQFEAAQKNVDKLTKEFNESVNKAGATDKATQELAKKLSDAEKEAGKFAKELDDVQKEAEQSEKALDDCNEEIEDTGKKAEKSGNGLSNFASKLGKGLATAAKIGAAAVGAASAAVVGLTKSAVESYAEYEQLVGGVETLFKTSSDAVMQYANNAYKTSGLSANAYMETATSFAASLIKSLDGDTAKAAEVANMAITDMSDNANKMGTSIDMIQNAYNGFAKGNFTMLDNLKLGYGGTQKEMERLLEDAQKISGIKYDISSFSDISEAIHVIQTDMEISGLTYEQAMEAVARGEMTMEEAIDKMGATAKEASTTIEGSLNMMKASWENLVVGMADSEADMGTLIDNFVQSTAIAAEQILPKISTALFGIGEVITALSPVIAEALPVLVEEVLPSLLEAAVSLVTALINGIITALPALGTALLEAVQLLLTDVFGVSEESAGQFADGVTGAFTAISDGFTALVEAAQTEGTWLNEIWTGLQEAGQLFSDFLVALWDAISSAFTLCVDQINTEGTYLNTIWENIKTYISAVIEVIQGVIKAFTAVLQGDWSAAWEAVQSIAQTVWDAITGIISNIVEWITGFLGTMVEKGTELIGSLAEGIQNKFAELFTLVGGWVTDNIVDPIADKAGDILNKGKEIIDNLKEGMKQAWESLKTWFTGVWNDLFTRNTTVTKNEDGSVNMKPAKTGLDYVPYDEFPALLHQGEAVLTAAEAERWRRHGLGDGSSMSASGGVIINQYIQSVPQTPVELASTTEAYFEQARWML